MTGSRRVVAVALVLSLGSLIVAALAIAHHRRWVALRQEIFAETQASTRAAAATIDRNHQDLVALVRELRAEIVAKQPSLADIDALLIDAIQARPHIFNVGVMVPAEPGETFVAPFVITGAEGHRLVRLDKIYDLRTSEWYADLTAHPEPGWHGPFYGPASKHFIAFYCEPWTQPGRPGALGHVCATWSLYEIETLRQTLPAGRYGYTWMLSHEARSLAHPVIDWVRSARTPDQAADEFGDPRLREVGRLATEGRAGDVEVVDPLTGRHAVMFQAPIPTAGWSLVAVVLEHDILAGDAPLRRRRLEIVIAVLATFAAAVAVRRPGAARMGPWWRSIVTSAAFLAGIVSVWSLELASAGPSRATPVIDTAAIERFLDAWTDRTGCRHLRRPVRIETGIELRTIVFPGPHDVILTGYVWQLYPPSLPATRARGVVFPDTIAQDDDVMREAWRVDTARGEVVGWFFRTTLHQPFDYAKFPIDERRVVLRMAHADPTEAVILVPNFAAYHAMYAALRPGLHDRLELPGWRIEASEFTMATTARWSGFGLPGLVAEGVVPELGLEVRLTRDFTNAFVSNLLPLMIVSLLLFGVLMTVTFDRARAEGHGFTTSAAYATNAALLFVTLLGHLQIREEVTTPQILYLEYFYFIAYVMILGVSVVAFVAASPGKHLPLLTDRDALLPKLLFWPLSFALFFAVTIWVFY
jgi:hypothetical protein